MKRINYIFAAALAILACGCNKEQVTEAVPDGSEVGVTFTAELPGMQTKAIGDGLTAKNLTVEVYEDEDGVAGTNIEALHQTATFTALKTDVKFNLVKGKTYHFIFWAQADNAPYTLAAAAKTVAISYAGEANDESRDAFYAVKTLKVQGPATEQVQLKRPFAQVNFGTADFAEAKAGGVEVTKSSFTATDAATSLDLFAGEGVGSTDITYTEKELPTEALTLKDGTTYTYMAMNYFVPTGKFAESHVSNVKAQFVSASHTVEISSPSTPVQSNWRTNIVGNLLTDQVVFNVEIVPAFEDETTIDIENITTAAGLRTALANGHSAKLAADITLDETISVPAGKDVVLDLDGHTLSNTEDLWDQPDVAANNWSLLSVKGGKLTIKGNGVLKSKANDCYAVDVQDGGEVIIEGGEYVGNIHAVYVEEGSAIIKGGKYSVQQKYPQADKADEFVLNCYDANRAAGTAKITVYGGEFVKFNPADCWAEGAHTNFLAPGYKTTKIGENYIATKADVTPVASNEGLNAAFNKAANDAKEITVNLSEGTFNWPDSKDGNNVKFPKTINVVGSSKENCFVKFGAGSYPEDSDVIFENVTIDNAVGCAYSEGTLAQMVRVKDVTVKNCIIKNQFRILAKGIVNIKNCQFINTNSSGFDGYCLNYYGYGGSTVNVANCTFDTVQKAIVIYSEGDVINYTLNVKDCKFTASDSSTDKAAIQMHTEHGIHGNVTINNCTATGFKTNTLSPEGLWWEGNNNSKVPTKKFTITVDGTTVQTAE